MRIVRLRSTRRRFAEAAVSLLFPAGPRVCRIFWSVEGYLYPHEGVLLYQIGRFASLGMPVIEIGSMRTSLSKYSGPAAVAEANLRVGERFDAVGRVGSISWGRVPGGNGWLPSLPGSSLVDAAIRFAKGSGSAPLG